MKAKTNDVSLSQVKDRDSPSRFNINEASLVIAP